PAEARRLVEDGARDAVQKAGVDSNDLQPLVLEPPIVVGIEFAHAGQADFAAIIPGFVRMGDRAVRYEAADGIEAYRAFVSAVRMAPTADT
ncbi:MAG: M55 family metallopeptidase, partial [Candidatus Limnocylindrales bacterium]